VILEANRSSGTIAWLAAMLIVRFGLHNAAEGFGSH